MTYFNHSFLQTYNKNGKKVSMSEICCNSLKHQVTFEVIKKGNKKGKYDLNITGLRASESNQRSKAAKLDGSVYHAKSWDIMRNNPILHWTNEMVWDYVKKDNTFSSRMAKQTT
jgi:3'-phosphoadenosine 5'-phosphosulfate sulfotransferase (PAPS reductase)/FAD synthetase